MALARLESGPDTHEGFWSGSEDTVAAWAQQLGLPEAQADELAALACIYPDSLLLRQGSHRLPIVQIPITTTHHKASVRLSVVYVATYPEESPIINLHSATIAKEYLLELRERLQAEAASLRGTVVVFDLVGIAEEAVASMPLSLTSQYCVCCPKCNLRLLKKRQPKLPQPAEQLQEGVFRCLVCLSMEASPLPGFSRNDADDPCDFCFCEESPLLRLDCGDKVCTTCFQVLSSQAIGARRLVLSPRSGHYTVACPNHPTCRLEDVNVFKLLDPATVARYHRFAFELGAVKHGGVVCPLPRCINAVFMPDLTGSLVRCPACYGFSCRQCRHGVLECGCKALARDRAPEAAPPLLNPQPPPCGDDLFLILVRFNGTELPLSLRAETTVRTAMELLQGELRIPAAEQYLFFAGKRLEPGSTMAANHIHLGAIVHLMAVEPQDSAARDEEIELWNFRKQTQDPAAVAAKAAAKIGKDCPYCGVEVVHYHRHGCHHIGYAGVSCCGQHWCYMCRGPHPCQKCPVFCDMDRKCGCPPCPDCTAAYRCDICDGCQKCSVPSDPDADPFS
eukprot:TRINITY_DN2815_c0_g1_i1.p1 TRINITY_DN2815_c0_g1~~TRINITY_DN2815_c0_g1_i1.p1  ORF type:complete len:563 (+),score=162.85 TRINITY_DN2815_c0_g1_i1:49-1737(+)